MVIAILWLISKPGVSKRVRVCAIIGSLAVLSAAYGAYLLSCLDFRITVTRCKWVEALSARTPLFFSLLYFNKA